MRIVASTACFLAAAEGMQRAVGAVPQSLFSGDAVWIWWLTAAGWLIAGLSILFKGVE